MATEAAVPQVQLLDIVSAHVQPVTLHSPDRSRRHTVTPTTPLLRQIKQ